MDNRLFDSPLVWTCFFIIPVPFSNFLHPLYYFLAVLLAYHHSGFWILVDLVQLLQPFGLDVVGSGDYDGEGAGRPNEEEAENSCSLVEVELHLHLLLLLVDFLDPLLFFLLSNVLRKLLRVKFRYVVVQLLVNSKVIDRLILQHLLQLGLALIDDLVNAHFIIYILLRLDHGSSVVANSRRW